MEKELKDRIKYLISKKKDLLSICTELELKDYEVIGLVELMKQDGELVDYVNGQLVKLKAPRPSEHSIEIPNVSDYLNFIAISDIHFGSKWDNPRLVEHAYETAEKEGCQFVTNSGDILDGDFKGARPNHIYEVKKIGIEQLDYAADKYPRSKIPTYFITGNHDATFMKTCGANVGKMLADKRPDLTYLGHDLADISAKGINIRLRHGIGGLAYAKGYKLQRYCETIPAKELPNMILQGHYHYSAYFKNRGIDCFNVGSLEGYTPYAKSMGLPQEMSFWQIKCGISNGEVVELEPKLYSFDEKGKAKRKVR